MKLRPILFAYLLFCVSACHDSTGPGATPENVIGFWGEDPMVTSVRGSVFVMSLADAENVVTGQGWYSSPGGAVGVLHASGTARGDSIHLQVVYLPNDLLLLPPDTARVDGAFETRDRIDAVRVRAGRSETITLIRMPDGAFLP